MPTFHFAAEVTVSATTTVEASTEEEALEIAEGRTVRLTRGPGDDGDGDEWVIEEADGDAREIRPQ